MSANRSNSKPNPQVEELKKKLEEANMEIMRLNMIINENGLSEDDIRKISDAEAICALQIKRLYDKSLVSNFSETDAKVLDILHKNLRLARGQVNEKDNSRKTKKMTNDQLLELVKDVQ